MGIQGLTKLLGDYAPGALREMKIEGYFGRKIAVDASMHIYQFMVVVGRVGDQLLASESGEVTSHLQGLFYRTARMLEAGIKPVFVFDGKPPAMKSEELARRSERRGEATGNLEQAKEAGDTEAIEKYSKRTVKVTREHNEECKRLLQLMGVPCVDAPCEAEAQCCAMSKAGLVYSVATEDMDALTFGTPRLTRHLMSQQGSSSKGNTGPMDFDYDKMLEEMKLTADQFIDMCILCGCDYCGTIRGIGAVRAYQLIQKHGSIEGVLENLDPAKYTIPDPFPYQEARKLFKEPDVVTPENMPPLKWTLPDTDGLIQFLVHEKSFSEERVRKAVDRIVAAKGKSSQGRLESFFGPTTVKTSTLKRKEPEVKGKGAASKKGKAGAIGAGRGKKK